MGEKRTAFDDARDFFYKGEGLSDADLHRLAMGLQAIPADIMDIAREMAAALKDTTRALDCWLIDYVAEDGYHQVTIDQARDELSEGGRLHFSASRSNAAGKALKRARAAGVEPKGEPR